MSEFNVIVTNTGINKLLESLNNGTAFPAAKMSVGDSNGNYYEPAYNQTSLVNSQYTAALFAQGKRNGYLYFDLQLPPEIGGFTIREVGLFDNDNNLLAVSKYPETYKQQAETTSNKTLLIEMQIKVSNEAFNNLIIDNSGNLITESDLSLALTAYEPKANVTSKGSATLPVYFDSNGVAQTITSYQGTSDKANKDGSGNVITSTYANKDLSNLSTYGNDFINQSKAMTTGSVSSNATVYSDILSRLHSSFDVSKFTVVGTPTITSDGILTNCSYPATGVTAAYTQTSSSYNLNSANSWKIICNYNPKDYSQHQTNEFFLFFSPSILTNGLHLGCDVNNKLNLYIFKDNNVRIASTVTNFNWTSNQNYLFKVGYNGTYYLYYSLDNGVSWSQIQLPENSSQKTVSGNVYIRNGIYGSLNVDYGIKIGTTDLKQFSITIDGVEVFSGNQTGIDTIKPSNFTAITSSASSPFVNPSLPFSDNGLVITDDGIASGFSSSNYIYTAECGLSTANSFEINFPVKALSSAPTTNKILWGLGTTSPNYFYFYVTANSNQYTVRGIDNSTVTLIPNNDYIFKWIRQNNADTLLYKNVNGDNFTTIVNSQATTTSVTANKLKIGNWDASNDSNYVWIGSIDLNAFKIYVDGNLVYQPCLKIPYTESKTGSKIVQSVYRDRVNDMAEQFGYAPYYTIDTEHQNFTLPMGDLYGMTLFRNHKEEILEWLTPDYANKVTINYNTEYTATSDGWVLFNTHLQVGANSTNTTSNIQVYGVVDTIAYFGHYLQTSWDGASGTVGSDTMNSGLFFVKKGQKIKLYTDHNTGYYSIISYQCEFMPCKK